MNRKEIQSICLKLLEAQIGPDQNIDSVTRPVAGWLHTVRQALGLSLQAVADTLKLSPQAIHQVEKSEANGTISLRQLETVAGAMGCRVAYVLVPRPGLLAERAAAQLKRATSRRQVFHSDQVATGEELPMALR